MKQKEITLDSLILQGEQILSGLTLSSNQYKTYRLQDSQVYENWSNQTLRFFAFHYPKDFQIEKLQELFDSFTVGQRHSPIVLEKVIGIMNGYKSFPQELVVCKSDNSATKINIVNENSNSQMQLQSQTLSIEILIDALKSELTGKQFEEIKAIMLNNNYDIEKKRTNVVEKLKSFGENVLAGILTTLITNAPIWSKL